MTEQDINAIRQMFAEAIAVVNEAADERARVLLSENEKLREDVARLTALVAEQEYRISAAVANSMS